VMFLTYLQCFLLALYATLANSIQVSRRSALQSFLLSVPSVFFTPQVALSEGEDEKAFTSAAFPKKELTNSIIASRDTNISPMEVYDVINSKIRPNLKGSDARALDVGAGAGVSTQVLYQQLGYKNIDAVDWSGDAWRSNVEEGGSCPSSVTFYELDDERFVKMWKEKELPRYDVIAFNFGINRDKALFFCQNLLKPDGVLLAPINSQKDYWLKQTYFLLDATGTVSWFSYDIGAWAVQFQPDVTAETCQGIWCAQYNGFVKLKSYE